MPVTGPLVLLVLAMAPALPGLFLLWRQVGRVVLFAVLGYGLAAAPQVVLTLAGILGGDAFLSFRTGSANDLSVRPVDGLVAASPVLLPVLLVLAAGIRYREPLWVAVSGGGAAAWFVAATNDVWGANQEPYRMYLNSLRADGGGRGADGRVGAGAAVVGRGYRERRRSGGCWWRPRWPSSG